MVWDRSVSEVALVSDLGLLVRGLVLVVAVAQVHVHQSLVDLYRGYVYNEYEYQNTTKFLKKICKLLVLSLRFCRNSRFSSGF